VCGSGRSLCEEVVGDDMSVLGSHLAILGVTYSTGVVYSCTASQHWHFGTIGIASYSTAIDGEREGGGRGGSEYGAETRKD
jgi:hypothetical protein